MGLMKSVSLKLFAAVAILSLAAQAPIAVANKAVAHGVGESFAGLAEKALPAVVNISTTQTIVSEGRPEVPPGTPFEDFFKDFFDKNREGRRSRQSSSLGSGFVIDPSGIIVTNNHVIAEADEIVVRFHDDLELPARVLGRDPKTDIAVLKVDSPNPLIYLPMGDSQKIRVGDWVIAIGNPFGLGGSVSAGIISARQRDIRSGPYDTFLQTDAAINKGNSGGPMVNMDGEVIGINSAILSPTGGSIGIGFAVPTSLAGPIIDQLQQFGETRRGWLGVHIQTVTDEIAESLGLARARGALVASVSKDGPAANGGIKDGDVILTFDGKTIDKVRMLPRIVAETKIGRSVNVLVWRNERERELRVVVERLDETKTASVAVSSRGNLGTRTEINNLGIIVGPLTAEDKERAGIAGDVEGVLILAVEEEGPAGDKNIRPGDVILEVNQDPVRRPSEVESRVAEAVSGKRKSVLLLLNRQGDLRFIAVRPRKS